MPVADIRYVQARGHVVTIVAVRSDVPVSRDARPNARSASNRMGSCGSTGRISSTCGTSSKQIRFSPARTRCTSTIARTRRSRSAARSPRACARRSRCKKKTGGRGAARRSGYRDERSVVAPVRRFPIGAALGAHRRIRAGARVEVAGRVQPDAERDVGRDDAQRRAAEPVLAGNCDTYFSGTIA